MSGSHLSAASLSTSDATAAVQHRLLTWEQIKQGICGRRAISLAGCLIVLVPSVVTTVAVQPQESAGSWLAALVPVGWMTIFTGLMLWLASSTILRKRYVQPVSIVLVEAVYFVTGALRPVFLTVYGAVTHQPSPRLDAGKIVQAGVTTCVLLSVLAVVLDIYDRQIAMVRQLIGESDELRALSERMLTDLAQRRMQLNDVVRVPVVTELVKVDEAMTGLLSGETIEPEEISRTITMVRGTVDQVVRPLATATRNQDLVEAEASVVAVPRRSWWESARELVSDSWLVTPFQPLPGAIMLFLLVAPDFLPYFGIALGFAGSVCSALLCYAGLAIARRFLSSSVLGQMPPPWRVANVLAVYVVVAVLAPNLQWIVYMIITDTGYRVVLAAGLAILLVALFWLSALVAAALRRQPRTVSDLQTISEALRFERDQRAIQLAEVKSAVADSLHGGVQSRLVAVVLLLEQAQMQAYADRPADARASIEAARAANLELIDNVGLAKEVPVQQESFDTALRRIIESWHGLMKIDVEISQDAMEKVTATPSIAGMMVELIRETVTNAVKHGRARAVDIELSVRDDELHYLAHDDGIGPSGKSRNGTGLKTLLGDTGQYSLTAAPDGGTVLDVSIPIAPAR